MVEIAPGKYIVYNNRVRLFEYIEFRYIDKTPRFKTIKYEKGIYIGVNEEGYDVYKAFGKYIVFTVEDNRGKVVEVLDIIGVSITFSVETRGGHQEFAVEITASTLTDKSVDEVATEIMDAVNKILYILYDIQKDIPKDHPASIIARGIRSEIWGSLDRGELECVLIKKYWEALTFIGVLTRDRKVYISEKIYKVGEEILTEEVPPEYPDVKLIIEQNKPIIRHIEIILRGVDQC